MVFSSEWEKIYQENKQMNAWPFTDLVSLVMRYAKPTGKDFRVLELGCGAGANIPFFQRLGVKYYAIEGSATVVEHIKQEYRAFEGNIACGDFTKEIPFLLKFDLVVDRSSLTHNSTASIKECVRSVYEKLEAGGKFIGIDWFSTLHSDYKKGKAVNGDRYTKTGFKDGQFRDVGMVHFSDKKHLQELLNNFDIQILNHKICKTEIPKNNFSLAVWNFVALKK